MSESGPTTVSTVLNGTPVTLTAEPRETLADALRRQHGVRSIRLGCEHGACGACTILVDGRSARSCLMLAVQADRADLRTADGLAESDPICARLVHCLSVGNSFQCGFCATGMLVTATELLTEEPEPDADQVRARLAGNLCRCTGYQAIVAGVLAAASEPTEEQDEVTR